MAQTDKHGRYWYNKRWRKKHPDKRNKEKNKYYRQFEKNARNGNQDWPVGHMDAILAPDRPRDRVLSGQLGRTVLAIQIMRSKIKKEIAAGEAGLSRA